jgi:hypothetical protein
VDFLSQAKPRRLVSKCRVLLQFIAVPPPLLEITATMNPLAWVAKKINAVSNPNQCTHSPASLILFCATQNMEDPMAREEKLITYLHTAQQAAEDRWLLPSCL